MLTARPAVVLVTELISPESYHHTYHALLNLVIKSCWIHGFVGTFWRVQELQRVVTNPGACQVVGGASVWVQHEQRERAELVLVIFKPDFTRRTQLTRFDSDEWQKALRQRKMRRLQLDWLKI